MHNASVSSMSIVSFVVFLAERQENGFVVFHVSEEMPTFSRSEQSGLDYNDGGIVLAIFGSCTGSNRLGNFPVISFEVCDLQFTHPGYREMTV